MFKYGSLALSIALALTISSCATPEVAKPPPPAPRVIRTYYYVGAVELSLKAQPGEHSADKAVVRLNEKVEKTETSKEGWFLVNTADGRSGWASSRYFKLRPVTDLFIAKWGLRLRRAPNAGSKSLGKLRKNDQVQILNPHPRDWVEIMVPRLGKKGWVEVKYLSTTKVATRHRRRIRHKHKKEAVEEAPPEKPAPVKPAPRPAVPKSL